eukprot:5824557-Amphidinium_carterae.1
MGHQVVAFACRAVFDSGSTDTHVLLAKYSLRCFVIENNIAIDKGISERTCYITLGFGLNFATVMVNCKDEAQRGQKFPKTNKASAQAKIDVMPKTASDQ